MRSVGDPYLEPTWFVDSDAPVVVDYARDAVGGTTDPVEQAVALFARVRDGIWYDPFVASADPVAYRASTVAASSANWCVPKAVLLTAAARALGIPARLGFADVRNHLQTPRLREKMGGVDEFVYHGYTDLLLDGRWVKATPAFNKELCARFGVRADRLRRPDGRVAAPVHGRRLGVHDLRPRPRRARRPAVGRAPRHVPRDVRAGDAGVGGRDLFLGRVHRASLASAT